MLFFLKNARRKKQQCGNFQVDHTPLQLCAPGCYYISVKLLETAAIIWILFTTLTYNNKNSIGHCFQLNREALCSDNTYAVAARRTDTLSFALKTPPLASAY